MRILEQFIENPTIAYNEEITNQLINELEQLITYKNLSKIKGQIDVKKLSDSILFLIAAKQTKRFKKPKLFNYMRALLIELRGKLSQNNGEV